MTLLTIMMLEAVLVVIVVAVFVLWRVKPAVLRNLRGVTTDDAIDELRAAVDDLFVAASRARVAADRIERREQPR